MSSLRLIQVLQILEPFLFVKRTGGLSIYLHVFAFYRCIQNRSEIRHLPLLDHHLLLIVNPAVLRYPQLFLGTRFFLFGPLLFFGLALVICTFWLLVSTADTFFVYLAGLFEIDQIIQIHELVIFGRNAPRYRVKILEVTHIVVFKFVLFYQFFSFLGLLFDLFFSRRLSLGFNQSFLFLVPLIEETYIFAAPRKIQNMKGIPNYVLFNVIIQR